MKIKIIKWIAVLMIFIGAFILIMQPFTPVTGNVIDLSTSFSQINFGVSFLVLVIGIIIFTIASFKEKSKLN